MSLEDLPSNSRRTVAEPARSAAPSEEPKLTQVEGIGKVVRRKKSFGRRLMDTFFRGDSGVVSYLIREIVIPTAQNLLTDMVTQGIEKAVYGEVRTPARRSPVRGASQYPVARGPHVSYDRVNQNTIIRGPQTNSTQPQRPVRQTAAVELDDIVLETEFGAQTIVEKLYEAIEDYGAATVANLKELLGETALYTDHKWGWTEGAEFKVRRIRGGFLLDYPDPADLR